MKKQTLIYAGAGAAAIVAIYLLTKKKPVTTVTDTVTPKADPVPPKLSEKECSQPQIVMNKMNAWLNSVLPPAPVDNSGVTTNYCIVAPCPQPTFPDKVMKERADYLVKATEYQTLRKEYENSWCALQKLSKNPWGLPEGQTPPYQPEPKIDIGIFGFGKQNLTPQPLTNSETLVVPFVVPFIKTPLASRI